MSKRCTTCRGRGRWQAPANEFADETIEMVWQECNDCKGTGVDQEKGGDPFDFTGESVEDDD